VRFAAHVDGFDIRHHILKPETIQKMTARREINANYARGWKVNTTTGGSLPGSTTILVRTSSHFCWAALTNTRREPADQIDGALHEMVWDMI